MSTVRSKQMKMSFEVFVNIVLWRQLDKFIPEVYGTQKYLKERLESEKQGICNEKETASKQQYFRQISH
jgi:hypothetical protein